MPYDFKHLSTKKENLTRKKKLSTVTILLIILLSIPVGWFGYSYYHLRLAKSELYALNYEKSLIHFIRCSQTGVFPLSSSAGVSLVKYLATGNEKNRIQLIENALILHRNFDHEFLYKSIFNAGDPDLLKSIHAKLKQKVKTPALLYYLGLSHLVSGKLSSAADIFIGLTSDEKFRLPAERQLNIIENMLQNPDFSRLTDRKNRYMQHELFSRIENGENRSLIEYILESSVLTETDLQHFISLTVDTRLQDSLMEILGKEEGLIAVLDSDTGKVLSVATTGNYFKENGISTRVDVGAHILFPLLTEHKTNGMKNTVNGKLNIPEKIIQVKSEEILPLLSEKKNLEIAYNFFGYNRNVTDNKTGFNSVLSEDYLSHNESKPQLVDDVSFTTPAHLLAQAAMIENGRALFLPGFIERKTGFDNIDYYNYSEQVSAKPGKDFSFELLRNSMKQTADRLKLSVEGMESYGIITDIRGGVRMPYYACGTGFIRIRNHGYAFVVIVLNSTSKSGIVKASEKLFKIISEYRY